MISAIDNCLIRKQRRESLLGTNSETTGDSTIDDSSRTETEVSDMSQTDSDVESKQSAEATPENDQERDRVIVSQVVPEVTPAVITRQVVRSQSNTTRSIAPVIAVDKSIT